MINKFWKWRFTGVIYEINRPMRTATIVHSESRGQKVGTTVGLEEIKNPDSDAGKPFTTYPTLEQALRSTKSRPGVVLDKKINACN